MHCLRVLKTQLTNHQREASAKRKAGAQPLPEAARAKLQELCGRESVAGASRVLGGLHPAVITRAAAAFPIRAGTISLLTQLLIEAEARGWIPPARLAVVPPNAPDSPAGATHGDDGELRHG
jgi:hypothetical protein